ncbi:MAG: outer membrane protein transport protein [Pseudomonadota bacterium]|jgi:long-chain fatty acid transport protein
MKKCFIIIMLAAAVVVFAAGPVMAGAFRIPESGTPAMGQANAFVGQADDPSAVHHNAAGIVNLEGTQIMGGMNMISPESSFTNLASDSGDSKDKDFLVPYFFYTNQFGDSDWFFGLGVNAPFGLGTEWDETAPFNVIPTTTIFFPWIEETTLEIIKIAPVVAYRVSDQLSVGFGPEYYDVQKVVYNGGAFAGATTQTVYSMKGDGDGFGFTLSGFYKASEMVNVGLAYHSAVTADLSGNAEGFPTDTFLGTGAVYTGSASVDLNLPATLALGVHFKASDVFSINLDLDQTYWSAYDKLEFKGGGTTFRTVTKDYEDVTAIRIGGEYSIGEYWKVRAGYLSEPSPVIEETFDPRLPDADATAIFLGGGYDEGQWAVNGAYMMLTKDDRDVDTDEPNPAVPIYDGTYKSSIDILAFDFIYRF